MSRHILTDRSGLKMLVPMAVVTAFLAMGIAGICQEKVDEAYEAVGPVLEELYGTPGPGGAGAYADPLLPPPTPDIAGARERFVEGGELLPGGGKLCLYPDGSGFIVMSPTVVKLGATRQAVPEEPTWREDQEAVFNELCPESLR